MLGTILVVSAIGLGAGVVLVIAAKILYVPVDETVIKIRNVLPGANCGACGFAGCDDYAGRLAGDKTIATTLCTPGGGAVANEISDILGVECGEIIPRKAFVACAGKKDVAQEKMEYVGPKSCAACNLYFKGKKSCTFGCIGFGDCAKVCNFGALKIVDGVAQVDQSLCTGCGACENVCPPKVIHIVPKKNKVYVACSSCDKGGVTRKVCSAGCIGCMKCQKICPFDAIHVENFCATIDANKCVGCKKCIAECPMKVIKLA